MNEKIKVYSDLIGVVEEAMSGKRSTSFTHQLGKRMVSIKLRMAVFAPDDVVKSFYKWLAISSQNADASDVIDAYAEVLLKMRKDIHSDTLFRIEDIKDALL